MKDSAYEKELMDALILKGHAIHKAEMEYHGNLDMRLEGYNTFLL